MPRRLALALCAAVLLVACGGSEPRPAASGASVAPARLETCDDGGSGGVMIRGVCL
jgi:hypothetical protein